MDKYEDVRRVQTVTAGELSTTLKTKMLGFETENDKMYYKTSSGNMISFPSDGSDASFATVQVTGIANGAPMNIGIDATGNIVPFSVAGGESTDIFDGNGVVSGLTISIGSPTSTFTVASGVYNSIGIGDITFTGLTNEIVTNIATQDQTYIAIDTATNLLIQQATEFTPEQRRTHCILGVLIHSNNSTINAVNNLPDVAVHSLAQLNDFMSELGNFNINGNVISANGANLSINKSEGTLYKKGVNFATTPNNPHTKDMPALVAPSNLRMRLSNGVESADTSVIFLQYESAPATVSLIPSNQFGVFRVVMFSSNLIRIQYPQFIYPTMAEAQEAISSEAYITESNMAENGLLRGYIIVRGTTTALNDTARAKFIQADRFGQMPFGGSGGGLTTLQGAYDNSIEPEIVTNSTLGAVSIKRGSASDTDNVFEIVNGAGTVTAYIKGNGSNSFIAQTVTNGVSATAPSQDAVYDFVTSAVASTPAKTLAQVLTAGNNATDLDIVNLDNLDVRTIAVNDPSTITGQVEIKVNTTPVGGITVTGTEAGTGPAGVGTADGTYTFIGGTIGQMTNVYRRGTDAVYIGQVTAIWIITNNTNPGLWTDGEYYLNNLSPIGTYTPTAGSGNIATPVVAEGTSLIGSTAIHTNGDIISEGVGAFGRLDIADKIRFAYSPTEDNVVVDSNGNGAFAYNFKQQAISKFTIQKDGSASLPDCVDDDITDDKDIMTLSKSTQVAGRYRVSTDNALDSITLSKNNNGQMINLIATESIINITLDATFIQEGWVDFTIPVGVQKQIGVVCGTQTFSIPAVQSAFRIYKFGPNEARVVIYSPIADANTGVEQDGTIVNANVNHIITVDSNNTIQADSVARVSYLSTDDRTYYTTNANRLQFGPASDVEVMADVGGKVHLGLEFDNTSNIGIVIDNGADTIVVPNLTTAMINTGGDQSIVTRKYVASSNHGVANVQTEAEFKSALNDPLIGVINVVKKINLTAGSYPVHVDSSTGWESKLIFGERLDFATNGGTYTFVAVDEGILFIDLKFYNNVYNSAGWTTNIVINNAGNTAIRWYCRNIGNGTWSVNTINTTSGFRYERTTGTVTGTTANFVTQQYWDNTNSSTGGTSALTYQFGCAVSGQYIGTSTKFIPASVATDLAWTDLSSTDKFRASVIDAGNLTKWSYAIRETTHDGTIAQDVIIKCYKNGTEVATVTIAQGASTRGVYTLGTPQAFSAGDDMSFSIVSNSTGVTLDGVTIVAKVG